MNRQYTNALANVPDHSIGYVCTSWFTKKKRKKEYMIVLANSKKKQFIPTCVGMAFTSKKFSTLCIMKLDKSIEKWSMLFFYSILTYVNLVDKIELFFYMSVWLLFFFTIQIMFWCCINVIILTHYSINYAC